MHDSVEVNIVEDVQVQGTYAMGERDFGQELEALCIIVPFPASASSLATPPIDAHCSFKSRLSCSRCVFELGSTSVECVSVERRIL